MSTKLCGAANPQRLEGGGSARPADLSRWQFGTQRAQQAFAARRPPLVDDLDRRLMSWSRVGGIAAAKALTGPTKAMTDLHAQGSPLRS
jgi:hypothetical protein